MKFVVASAADVEMGTLFMISKDAKHHQIDPPQDGASTSVHHNTLRQQDSSRHHEWHREKTRVTVEGDEFSIWFTGSGRNKKFFNVQSGTQNRRRLGIISQNTSLDNITLLCNNGTC